MQIMLKKILERKIKAALEQFVSAQGYQVPDDKKVILNEKITWLIQRFDLNKIENQYDNGPVKDFIEYFFVNILGIKTSDTIAIERDIFTGNEFGEYWSQLAGGYEMRKYVYGTIVSSLKNIAEHMKDETSLDMLLFKSDIDNSNNKIKTTTSDPDESDNEEYDPNYNDKVVEKFRNFLQMDNINYKDLVQQLEEIMKIIGPCNILDEKMNLLYKLIPQLLKITEEISRGLNNQFLKLQPEETIDESDTTTEGKLSTEDQEKIDSLKKWIENLEKIKTQLEKTRDAIPELQKKCDDFKNDLELARSREKALRLALQDPLDYSTMTLKDFFDIAKSVEDELLSEGKITAKVTREDGTLFIERFGQQININDITTNQGNRITTDNTS